MKKLAGLVMAFLAVGMMMTSCTKDNEELILGTWNMDMNKSYESYTENGVTEQMTYAEMGMGKVTITFKEGGVMTVSTTASNESDGWDTEYTIKDDVLTWEGIELHILKHKGIELHILKLNKDKLILGETEDETEDGIFYSFTEHMEFDRE